MYVVYKENILPILGGVNPVGIEIGLAEYNDWKLANVPDDKLNEFFEFKFYPIPEEIAYGLMLQGKLSKPIHQDDVQEEINPDVEEDMKIQEDAEELVKLAKLYLDKLELKIIVRAHIEKYKDLYDDIADTKLLLEFILAYIVDDWNNKTEQEKNKFEFKDILDNLIDAYDEFDLRIKEDGIENKIIKILNDEIVINNIVNDIYKSRIKELGV